MFATGVKTHIFMQKLMFFTNTAHGWRPARLGLTRFRTFRQKSVRFGRAGLEMLGETWPEISKDGWPADWRPAGPKKNGN